MSGHEQRHWQQRGCRSGADARACGEYDQGRLDGNNRQARRPLEGNPGRTYPRRRAKSDRRRLGGRRCETGGISTVGHVDMTSRHPLAQIRRVSEGSRGSLAHASDLSRREMLRRSGSGLGAIALAALLADDTYSNAPLGHGARLRELHHAAKVRNIIFLYMDGGPSQVDTFDYKPLLARYDGQDPHRIFRVEPTQFNNVGRVMK